MAEKAKWYVVHTYSGYENKVKVNLEKAIENKGQADLIQDLQVPMEEITEEKNGKQKVIQKKIFPGYVLVKMIMSDESWYTVRNTRGVTGFVGPGSKPVPLSDDEVKAMGIKDTLVALDIKIGESIRIISGPLQGFTAAITEINSEKRKIKGLVNMFGRDIPAELEYNQIEKLD
ncbi:MAG: transcription termination/antitermination protein NusG [Oscillospiraceae bacterium]|nr:transcription termination/antitermination protein NusG [Oscillospiraceae bacterium]